MGRFPWARTVVVGAVLAALLAPAAGGAAQTAPAAFGPYGGTVTVSYSQEPPTLNPFVPGGGNFIVEIVGEAYWAQTFKVDATSGEFLPEVVRSVPTVANGGVVLNGDGTMTVTYDIRNAARWSDGIPISGDDYQFTLDTILRDDLPIGKAIYEDIVSTDVGAKTFSYTLPESLSYLTLFPRLIPEHAVESSNFLEDWNTTTWPSGGPFVFSEWQPGEMIRLEANPHYWGTDPATGAALPYFDEVIVRFIPDVEAELDAFTNRLVDVMQPDPDYGLLDAIDALAPQGADLQVANGPIWEHLNFQFGPNNRNPETLNEHLAFRQAIAHAIDRQALVDDVQRGYGTVTQSFYEAYNAAFTRFPWTQYDYDPVRAAQLLDEACVAAGRDCDADPPTVIFSTTSNNAARLRLSELLGPMLETIGIAYEVELEDSQLFFGDTFNDGTWDVGEWAWLGSPQPAEAAAWLQYVDPDNPCPTGTNCYRWGTPDSSVIDAATMRMGEIVDDLEDATDVDSAIALLLEAEQILADQAVIIPLYRRVSATAVWADTVEGVRHGSYNSRFTWNIGEWRMAETPELEPGVCDFNGDGLEDTAFASPGETVDGEVGAGMVQEIRAQRGSGIVNRRDVRVWTQNTTDVKNIAERNDRFGAALACGDFDGDGFGDLAIGVPGEGLGGKKQAGGVAVLYGNRFGLKATGNQFWHQDSPGIIDDAEAGDRFGEVLAAGDFNNDGYHDLAIGAPGDEWDVDSTGLVNVLFGDAGGLSETDWYLIGGPSDVTEPTMALAVADWDRDGFDDLAVGLPDMTVDGVVGAGTTAIAFGNEIWIGNLEQLLHQDIDGIQDRAQTGDRFGATLAAGDFNGDGRVDLAVGVPGESLAGTFRAGMVHVLYARADGLAEWDARLDATDLGGALERNARFGSALAAGALNVSTGDDLAIGVPDADSNGLRDSGAVHVAYGDSDGLGAGPVGTYLQVGDVDKRDRFGAALAIVDADDDRNPDLMVGAPDERMRGEPQAGRIDLLIGTTGGLVTTDTWWRQGKPKLSGEPNEGDHFGAAIGG